MSTPWSGSATGRVNPVESLGNLNQKRGDVLGWELDKQSVRIRLVSSVDLNYLRGIEANLSEWASDADEAAFAGL